MYILLTVIHVILCIALILIVLLQTGKGSDLASAFGGGGTQAVFGGRGPASFLNKMTTAIALLFMATSISLAYLSSGRSGSIMEGLEEPASVEEVVGDKTPIADQTNQQGNVTENKSQQSEKNVAPSTEASNVDKGTVNSDANQPANVTSESQEKSSKGVDSKGENN